MTVGIRLRLIAAHLDCEYKEDMAYLQTTDASTQSIVTLPMEESTGLTLFALISGIKSDESAGAGGSIMAAFRRASGGNATNIGGTTTTNEDHGTGTPAISVSTSSGNILIQVAGVASETWDWVCHYSYLVNKP